MYRRREKSAFLVRASLARQDAELGAEAGEAENGPTAADLAAVATRLDETIANGNPTTTKALLRLLIAELRVHSRTHIQSTSGKVPPAGVEPALPA